MYRERLFAVLVKIEPQSGTDAAPTAAANAVRAVGIPVLQVNDLESGDRSDAQTGQLGGMPDRAAPAGTYCTFDLTLEVKGAGLAYADDVRPEADALLRASALGATVDATAGAEKVTYSTIDAGFETATVYGYTAGGKLFKLIGCVATLKAAFEAAKRSYLTFGITGKLKEAPTEAAVPAVVFDPAAAAAEIVLVPPLFQGQQVAIGAWNSGAAGDPLMLAKVDLDFGNQVAELPGAGAADGLHGHAITDRKVQQTMNFNAPALATLDVFALSKADSAAAPVTSYQSGGAKYNRMKVVTGRWQFGRPKVSSVKGIINYALAGGFTMGTEPVSGREIALIFD